MRQRFLRLGIEVIAVQIRALRIFPRVQREANRIQAWQQKNLRSIRPVVFLKQAQSGARPGWFITMNARADVNSGFWLPAEFRLAMQRQPFEFASFVKNFRTPAGFFGGDFGLAQHGADVNGFAVIATQIFAEFLHAENIMQLVAPKCNEGGRREVAKNKSLTCLSLATKDNSNMNNKVTLIKRCLASTIVTYVTVLTLIAPAANAQNLFISDYGSGTILEISPEGTVTTFASGLTAPLGLAFDNSGNLFVAEGNTGGTISKITPDGTVTTFASGFSGAYGAYGLAFNSSGDLFTANEDIGTISKITADGTVTAFASGLNNPIGLAFNSSGDLFVANEGNSTISKITPDGTVTTFASALIGSRGIAFNNSDDLFVANYDNSTVSKIAPDGTTSSFASGLNNPLGLAFNDSGNLFAVNVGDGTISEIFQDGIVSSFASGLDGPQFATFQPAPEPSTLLLAGLGGFAFVMLRCYKLCISRGNNL